MIVYTLVCPRCHRGWLSYFMFNTCYRCKELCGMPLPQKRRR